MCTLLKHPSSSVACARDYCCPESSSPSPGPYNLPARTCCLICAATSMVCVYWPQSISPALCFCVQIFEMYSYRSLEGNAHGAPPAKPSPGWKKVFNARQKVSGVRLLPCRRGLPVQSNLHGPKPGRKGCNIMQVIIQTPNRDSCCCLCSFMLSPRYLLDMLAWPILLCGGNACSWHRW